MRLDADSTDRSPSLNVVSISETRVLCLTWQRWSAARPSQ